jgi:hypothetical protein
VVILRAAFKHASDDQSLRRPARQTRICNVRMSGPWYAAT